MAKLCELTKKQESAWKRWVAKLPPIPRAVAEKFDGITLYRLKTTGQRVTVESYGDDGTVTVNVSGRFNLTPFERDVFGIDPADLEPCDLPESNEEVGSILSHAEVGANIDMLRATVRPDLFILDDAGHAVRKQ